MASTLARLLFASIAVSCAVSALGCQTPLVPAPSFRLPEPELRQRVQTICLEGVYGGFKTRKLAPRIWRISEFVDWKLGHAGFRVERVGFWDTVREARDAAGGAYDEHTGRLVPEREAEVDAAVATALIEKHGCDARLRLYIHSVKALWSGSHVYWDGVQRPIVQGGGFASGNGSVGALSLWMEMRDMDGNMLYARAGGIQTMARMSGTFWVRHTEAVEEEDMFANDAWNAEAVFEALGSLAGPAPPEVLACAPEVSSKDAKRQRARRLQKEKRVGCEWQHFEATRPTTWEEELARQEARKAEAESAEDEAEDEPTDESTPEP